MHEPTLESTEALTVSNPFQAVTDIFYRPRAVFDALAVKDNWSWIPFILIILLSLVPIYLYFNMVDFNWYSGVIAQTQLPNASPAEVDALSKAMTLGTTQTITIASIAIGMPIAMAIYAGYFTLWTRNDEKSIQGFTDWYGAMWWITMPTIINALLACIYLLVQEPNTQISVAALAPTSIAFIAGIDMTNQWFNLLNSIRVDSIWTIVLATICLRSWTNFGLTKAAIVAAIPSALIWSLTFFLA